MTSSTSSDLATVSLSNFADEMTPDFRGQITSTLALGMRSMSIRSGDVLGTGESKNVMLWSQDELKKAQQMLTSSGVFIAEVGSPIGKVKLVDVEDGTKNRFVPFQRYLDEDVRRALDLAGFFGCNRLRGFSFYPPKGSNPDDYFNQAADQVAAIVQLCAARRILYGCEVEANLVGDRAERLMRLREHVGSPWFRLVFDPANITCQNLKEVAAMDFKALRFLLGWFHAKEYKVDPNVTWKGHVDEETLKNFVPLGYGNSGYDQIVYSLARALPTLHTDLNALDIPSFLITLEPHLRRGGQFGGYTGPDGMRVALQALLTVLATHNIETDLIQWEEVKRTPEFRI